MSDHIDDPHTVDETASHLNSMHLDPPVSDNGSDSNESVPDLVPADSESDVHIVVEHARPTTPVTQTNTHGVDNVNAGPPAYQHPGPFIALPNNNHHGLPNGVIQGGPSAPNWRAHGPAHLAHRAVRDAVLDRYANLTFAQGGGNAFRRGGAPYHMQGRGRALNPDMVYDLALRVQRIEQIIHDVADHQHWVVHRF